MRPLFLLFEEEGLFSDFPCQNVFPSEEKNIETVSANTTLLIRSQLKTNAEIKVSQNYFQPRISVQLGVLLHCKQNTLLNVWWNVTYRTNLMSHVSDLPVIFSLVSPHSFQFLCSLLQSNFRLSQEIWKWSELIQSSLKVAVDLKKRLKSYKKLENQIPQVTLISFLTSLQSVRKLDFNVEIRLESHKEQLLQRHQCERNCTWQCNCQSLLFSQEHHIKMFSYCKSYFGEIVLAATGTAVPRSNAPCTGDT